MSSSSREGYKHELQSSESAETKILMWGKNAKVSKNTADHCSFLTHTHFLSGNEKRPVSSATTGTSRFLFSPHFIFINFFKVSKIIHLKHKKIFVSLLDEHFCEIVIVSSVRGIALWDFHHSECSKEIK